MSWDLTKLGLFCILYAQESYCHGSLTNQAITIDEWIIVCCWRPRWQIIRKSVKTASTFAGRYFCYLERISGEKLDLEWGECGKCQLETNNDKQWDKILIKTMKLFLWITNKVKSEISQSHNRVKKLVIYYINISPSGQGLFSPWALPDPWRIHLPCHGHLLGHLHCLLGPLGPQQWLYVLLTIPANIELLSR